MERPTPTDMMPKKDHERDVELDTKIEALRRKNEALMRRHKEVEEDRKRAEEEGMALLNRKGKAEDLTITISKSTNDSRVVVTKPLSGDSPAARGQQEAGPDRGGERPSAGRCPGPQEAAHGHHGWQEGRASTRAAAHRGPSQAFRAEPGAREAAGEHRPQHPHVEGGAGGVRAVEEGARADRQGESGPPQKRQGPVETGVGHGQNREHVVGQVPP
uniref:Coiled-coil domain containing 9B n=1 Tax=Gasterosteus aculeatus aculeatus TaxID=481459 RepID=A0AAQ4PZ42_GASAC